MLEQLQAWTILLRGHPRLEKKRVGRDWPLQVQLPPGLWGEYKRLGGFSLIDWPISSDGATARPVEHKYHLWPETWKRLRALNKQWEETKKGLRLHWEVRVRVGGIVCTGQDGSNPDLLLAWQVFGKEKGRSPCTLTLVALLFGSFSEIWQVSDGGLGRKKGDEGMWAPLDHAFSTQWSTQAALDN